MKKTKKETKYIFLKLEFTSGEETALSKTSHVLPEGISKDKFAKEYAKTFFPGGEGKYNKTENWFEFFNGENIVEIKRVVEISKEDFEVLKKYDI